MFHCFNCIYFQINLIVLKFQIKLFQFFLFISQNYEFDVLLGGVGVSNFEQYGNL